MAQDLETNSLLQEIVKRQNEQAILLRSEIRLLSQQNDNLEKNIELLEKQTKILEKNTELMQEQIRSQKEIEKEFKEFRAVLREIRGNWKSKYLPVIGSLISSLIIAIK